MIKYIEGDLFQVVEREATVILPHCCNDIFAWGSGFVVPLGRHYPEAKKHYLAAESLILGETQFVDTGKNVIVANMIGQHKTGRDEHGNPPIRYQALEKCIIDVAKKAKELISEGKQVEIVAPMFGSGLAGGSWPSIEQLIKDHWGDLNVQIHYFIQDLPQNWTLPEN